jgi:hypothetical protein
MPPDSEAYNRNVKKCIRDEFGYAGVPGMYSAELLASMVTDIGGVAGPRNWLAHRSNGSLPEEWVRLNLADVDDRRIAEFLSGTNLDLLGRSYPVFLSAVRRFPGAADMEVDVNRVPVWALPRVTMDQLAGSFASARAGVRPLLTSLFDLRSNYQDVVQMAAVNVHATWVCGRLDSHWDRAQRLMVPFALLEAEMQNLDVPFGAQPIQSFRRVLVDLGRLAANELGHVPQQSAACSIEERLVAEEVFRDLIDHIGKLMSVTYRAHRLSTGSEQIRYFTPGEPIPNTRPDIIIGSRFDVAAGKTLPPSVDLREARWGERPQRFIEGDRRSAAQLIVALADALAVRDNHRVNVEEILSGFLRTYVEHQDQLGGGGRATDAQRSGVEALSGDELLLNARMVEGGLNVFRAFVVEVHNHLSHYTAPRLANPLVAAQIRPVYRDRSLTTL